MPKCRLPNMTKVLKVLKDLKDSNSLNFTLLYGKNHCNSKNKKRNNSPFTTLYSQLFTIFAGNIIFNENSKKNGKD